MFSTADHIICWLQNIDMAYIEWIFFAKKYEW